MKQIIISALYLIIIFCLSYFVFDPAYLYYEIWWLDIPMHILGGFGVAALTNAILVYRGMKSTYWKLFFAYLFVALVWELYEYGNSIVGTAQWGGVLDTLKDLFDGAVGASVAYLLVKK
jgi:hypothetical protein